MRLKVKIPFLQGKWTAPASKSELIRYIAIAMQCEEESLINNVTWCNDSFAMLNIAESWGAHIEVNNQKIICKGKIIPEANKYNAEESALCLRLMTPLLSKHEGKFILNAEGSLLARQIGEIERVLNQIGANIVSNNGYPPVIVNGKISSADISIEYPLSSQNISGLLFTLPQIKGNSSIRLKRLISLPYIKVTLKCLSNAGIEIQVNDTYTEYYIKGEQNFSSFNASVEGDWSAASVLFAGASIYGNLYAHNLSLDSLQADKDILNFIFVKDLHKYLHIKTQKIKSFRTDITHCPDLFPALVVLAMHADGISEIYGINRLLHKESNRIDTFMQEFSKFGVKFSSTGDKITIRPPLQIESCEINTHNDHRIAMAAAIAITGTKAHVIINDAQCVNKSYTSFWEDIACLGAEITEV